jgi:hypothetical protein
VPLRSVLVLLDGGRMRGLDESLRVFGQEAVPTGLGLPGSFRVGVQGSFWVAFSS